MLVSYKWLQTYFKDELPAPEKAADVLTMGVFEIESLEKKDNDAVLDVKTLPDRNPYALSHRYVAHELGVLLKLSVTFPELKEVKTSSTSHVLSISIHDSEFCYRYIGRLIEGVGVSPSPAWLKEKLEVLGQRSINSIVDLTNFVMLDTGQPLHAFDADKVEGSIVVRKAKEGEEIILLDGTVVKLTPEMFVIADEKGSLAIAGVKGGKKAEVTSTTKNIILEAATFNSSSVRKTAQKVNIRNDSTKRFENQITTERALLAMDEVSGYIAELNPNAQIGEKVDIYPRAEMETQRTIEVTAKAINERIGIEISQKEIIDILTRCNLGVEEKSDKLILSIPTYRSDLVIFEDIVDEVGRIYGYDKVPGILPPVISNRRVNKNFYYYNLIRKTFIQEGFSEVFTYTLQDQGDIALANPLNAFRGYMRDNLSRGLAQKLEHNIRYADLLGLNEIKIFEIGNIFGGKKERSSLAYGTAHTKAPKGWSKEDELKKITDTLAKVLGVELSPTISVQGVVEIELDLIITTLSEPTQDVEWPVLPQVTYKSFSTYPFAVRDIAVFVPGEKGKESEVLEIIKSEAGDLLVRTTLFDVFTKTDKETGEEKTSYAYRLVFQANDRTLNEEDLNSIMKKITDTMNGKKSWIVR